MCVIVCWRAQQNSVWCVCYVLPKNRAVCGVVCVVCWRIEQNSGVVYVQNSTKWRVLACRIVLSGVCVGVQNRTVVCVSVQNRTVVCVCVCCRRTEQRVVWYVSACRTVLSEATRALVRYRLPHVCAGAGVGCRRVCRTGV